MRHPLLLCAFLTYTSLQGYDEIDNLAQALKNIAETEDALMTAIKHYAPITAIKDLLNKKADVNSHGLNDRTPLHEACDQDNLALITLLIHNGANVKATDVNGITPLHLAYGIEAIKLLITNGADINAADKMGLTPLHSAADFPNFQAVELLIKNGANIKAIDKSGKGPLAWSRCSKITLLLKNKGAA